MVGFADLLTSFILGLLTPLTAVCVLPLYPGFLAYLSAQFSTKQTSKVEQPRNRIAIFGLIVVAGVILFMLLLGLIFTTLLKVSLTKVIGIVSPIAFGILVIISLLLIFNVDIGKYLPKLRTPTTKAKNPWLNALIFGFFFGAIVIPFNPLFIAALFTKTIAGTNFIANMLNFLVFGIGIGAPLLVFSILSTTASSSIINWLTKQRRNINLVTGVIMLAISLYYLIFVFKIFG